MHTHLLDPADHDLAPCDARRPADETPSSLVWQARSSHAVSGTAGLSGWQDLDGSSSECAIPSDREPPLKTVTRRLGSLLSACRQLAACDESDEGFHQLVADRVVVDFENAVGFEDIEAACRTIEAIKDQVVKETACPVEEEVGTGHDFGGIIGESRSLRRVLKQVETVAPTDSTVLVRGETGTGKELLARAVHDLSPRKGRAFVKLNCAAIPTGLLESELFGHEKGAFTSAISQKLGRFELANRGTLFLDEVGEIPLELQPKLLRVLQEQEFERLGGTRTIKVDLRLVAATNRDLGKMVAEGRFRSDLYYRLNVFPLTLPPLRDRQDDIPRLVRHFTHRFAKRMGRGIETIPASVMEALVGYHWPGNVRELQNVIERAVILSRGPTLRVPLDEFERAAAAVPPQAAGAVKMADAEREHILAALRNTGWRVGGPRGAASQLGMKRTTLQKRMKKLGVCRGD